MNIRNGVVVVVLGFAAGGVAMAQAKSPQVQVQGAGLAAKICESGVGDRYGHPAGACWVAYEVSKTRLQLTEALGYVRVGCDKYQRTDFCMFLAHFARHPLQRVSTANAADRAALRRALELAESYVSTADVEDGEVVTRRQPLKASPAH